MDNGYPNVPVPNDFVIFKTDWHYIQDLPFQASTTVSATITGNNHIPSGTVGRVIGTEIDPGYSNDVATAYKLFVGVYTAFGFVVLKIPFSSRPDVLEALPDTPAARVLYGKK
jgi:hypothetical protein